MLLILSSFQDCRLQKELSKIPINQVQPPLHVFTLSQHPPACRPISPPHIHLLPIPLKPAVRIPAPVHDLLHVKTLKQD